MSIEFEAKFLDIDKIEMRKILKDLGATLVHEKQRYVRIIFKRCTDDVKGFARIRNEGDKVTMTVKIYKDPKFPEEYEVEIKDGFEKGANFLRSLGLEQKAFQETYREKWSHPLAHEITFDDVPGIPTYMEVDCTGEENLNKLVDLLKLDKSKMRFGAYGKQYEEYLCNGELFEGYICLCPSCQSKLSESKFWIEQQIKILEEEVEFLIYLHRKGIIEDYGYFSIEEKITKINKEISELKNER